MAAPQLRLEVSLNLTGFRGEIQKLTNIAQSEFAPKINVKFNRRTLDTELNNLQAAIKRRTYRIEIGGNINSFPRAIENIRKQLAALETQNKIEIPISVKNGVTQKEARKVRSSVYRSVMAEGGKILLPVGLRPVSQTASDKFKTDLRQKLGSITVKIKADLESASISSGAKSRSDIEADVRRGLEAISEIGAQRMAGGTGGVTEPARREQLKQSLSQGGFDIATLKEIGKQLGVSGVGRFKIANNLIEKIVTESSIEMVKKYLDPQAVMRNPDRSGLGKVLDTFARGIFNMLGMDPASIRAQQQASKPKLFTPAGLLGPSAEPAGLLPPAYRGIGPSAKPAGLLPSLSSAGRSNAIIEALIASTGPRLLPSGGGDDSLGKLAAPRQTKDAVDAILRNYFKVVEAQVKEVFSAPPVKKESLNIFDHLDTEQYFNYLAQARINAENAIKRSIEEAKQVTKRNQIKDAAQSFLRALEEVVRNAERSAFTQSRIAANRSYVQRANIREIGQPLLGGRQVTPPKMLSAATGFYRGAATPPPLPETQAQLFARREREARMRSVLRGVDVMGETPTRAPARYSYANRPAMPRRPTSAIVPYEAGGALVPSGGGGGGAPPVPPRGGGGGGAFGGMQFNVPKLPGAGLVREIGEEFGFAAKQVLLYGTAYKALGLLQAFPSQVGEAVGALQSFRNTLNAISPTAQEAAASSEFILNIVDKYNVPLQSARDGFTKLYASMAPTGFNGNEIRDLFTGISQAAATFGMSSDKVDRVTYAFAQMASKGQVMSEELKGQLGDVLPGAMGIFAKAAGFEGADAIQKFGKALEDGAYKGKPMRDLLKNVTIELKKEFGPGAEGAARTYQGVMTRMANSTKLLYESFEPVAINFLNSIVVPITGGLKTVTDGFKAFFTGQAAQTTGGGAFAKQLEALRPAFEGIRSNITSLVPIFQSFGKILLATSQVFLQIAGNPFVGYLARVYLNVVALTTVVNILNLRALIPFIANLARSIYSVVAFGVQCTLAGQKAVFFDLMVRTLGTTLRTFFAATAVGIILVGIGLIAEAFVTAGARADAARQKMSQFADSVKQLGAVGDVAGATAEKVGQQSLATRLQSAKTLLQQVKSEGRKLTKAQVQELKNLQLTNNLDFVEVRRGPEKGLLVAQGKITDLLGTQSALQAEIDSAGRGYLETQTKIVQATKAVTVAQGVQRKQEKESKTAEPTAIDLAGGKDAKTKSLESYYSLQDQLAKNFTQAEIDRLEAEHQQKIDLIKSEYDLKEARANSFQKEALRFERRMAEITLERQGALLKASNAVLAAQGSVAGGAVGGAASGGKGLGAGIAQYITGDPASPFYKADHGGGNYHEHLAFVSRQAAEEAYKKLTSAGIKVTEFKGKSKVGGHTPGSAHYEGLAFDVPASQVPVGQERGLTARVQSILGIGGGGTTVAGAGAARKVPGSEKRDIVADQKTQLEQVKQSVTARQSEAKAIEDAKVALADFVATATPAEEQKLQNDLLKRRTELMMQGYSDSAVDQALKFAEAEYKVNFALKLNEELERKGARTKEEAAAIARQMTEGLASYSSALEENTIRLRDNQLAQAMTVLKDRMAMAGAMTPDQELREQIRQRNPDFLPERQEGLFQQEKLVQGAEKLKADLQGIAGAIGDSFGEAFKGIITGSMTAQEALAGLFQSVGNYFADMVAKMIAEWLKAQLIKGFMNIIGAIIPGFGAAAGGGLSDLSAPASINNPLGDLTGIGGQYQYANGGIAPGGFQAFANGGVVTGPTLGLVGEGRYNEAVIPLPDGKSVPVQLSGGDGGNQINSNITVNVSNGQAQSNATGSNSSELGRKIEGAVKQVIVGELRPGGLLASR